MTVLNFAKDAQGTSAYAPQVSDHLYGTFLAQNTETHITIPSASTNYIVLFSYSSGANVWVDMSGATAVVPSSPTLGTVTAELLPGQRQAPGGTKISIITSDTAGAEVGIALYGIP